MVSEHSSLYAVIHVNLTLKLILDCEAVGIEQGVASADEGNDKLEDLDIIDDGAHGPDFDEARWRE